MREQRRSVSPAFRDRFQYSSFSCLSGMFSSLSFPSFSMFSLWPLPLSGHRPAAFPPPLFSAHLLPRLLFTSVPWLRLPRSVSFALGASAFLLSLLSFAPIFVVVSIFFPPSISPAFARVVPLPLVPLDSRRASWKRGLVSVCQSTARPKIAERSEGKLAILRGNTGITSPFETPRRHLIPCSASSKRC